jgi:hypothetical protein
MKNLMILNWCHKYYYLKSVWWRLFGPCLGFWTAHGYVVFLSFLGSHGHGYLAAQGYFLVYDATTRLSDVAATSLRCPNIVVLDIEYILLYLEYCILNLEHILFPF